MVALKDTFLSFYRATICSFWTIQFLFANDTDDSIFRSNQERSIVLGYRPNDGLYANTYVFKGNTDTNSELEGGGTLGYNTTIGKLSADTSVGMISNLAESEGMQLNGAAINDGVPSPVPFAGFGLNSTTEKLVHAVPGFDARVNLSYGAYTFIGEYVTATKRFDSQDMGFGHIGDGPVLNGAQPAAFHAEGIYSFYIYGKPSTAVMGYDFTKQALALLLPEQRIWAALNVSFWRDTIATLEIRHDIEYGENDLASGRCGTASCTPVSFGPLGKTDNAVTMQFGVYF